MLHHYRSNNAKKINFTVDNNGNVNESCIVFTNYCRVGTMPCVGCQYHKENSMEYDEKTKKGFFFCYGEVK